MMVVPSVCCTVTSQETVACLLRMFSVLRLRCTPDAGDATTSVVVAVVIAVFVRLDDTVPLALSSHDACTSSAAAALEMTCSLSDVDARMIISRYFGCCGKSSSM